MQFRFVTIAQTTARVSLQASFPLPASTLFPCIIYFYIVIAIGRKNSKLLNCYQVSLSLPSPVGIIRPSKAPKFTIYEMLFEILASKHLNARDLGQSWMPRLGINKV